MASYSDLYDFVVPDMLNTPLTVVYHAIRQAVIDLCERTQCYRQELQQILVMGPVATTTSAAAAILATSIEVADITSFNDGDTITVELEDGTKWRGHVSGTPIGSTINLDGQLPVAVESGAGVVKLVYLYTMTMPTGTAFSKGLNAWLNDNWLEPISADDLNNEFNNAQFGWVGVNWRTDVNLPTRWYIQNDDTVALLLPPQSGNSALRIEAALKPTISSTTFPTWMLERYSETIAHGAKARMMLSPKKPYSDAKLGAYHQQQFFLGIADARTRAARGATRAALRTHTVYGLR